MNPPGKLPLGFHHSRSDIMKLWRFGFCCLMARTVGLAHENTGTRTAHCLCQLPPWLHCTTPIDSGPALFIPLPHTQLCNSFSARSRRTTHGPHADCSFRLAIFELTSTNTFQPQEERRDGLRLAILAPLHFRRRPRSSHSPVQNDFLGKEGTLCRKQYVQ